MKTLFMICKNGWNAISMPALMATMLLLCYMAIPGYAYSKGDEILNTGMSGKALIDFRTNNPKLALVYLKLIGDTYKDRQFKSKGTHPEFVVKSVKLLAKDPKGYSPQELKTIDEVKNKITALAGEGIKFDYCLYGGNLFGVTPATIPGVGVVDNGWVSLVNYQAHGYSIIPAY